MDKKELLKRIRTLPPLWKLSLIIVLFSISTLCSYCTGGKSKQKAAVRTESSIKNRQEQILESEPDTALAKYVGWWSGENEVLTIARFNDYYGMKPNDPFKRFVGKYYCVISGVKHQPRLWRHEIAENGLDKYNILTMNKAKQLYITPINVKVSGPSQLDEHYSITMIRTILLGHMVDKYVGAYIYNHKTYYYEHLIELPGTSETFEQGRFN